MIAPARPAWHSLMIAFLEHVSAGADAETVWRLFVADTWFQEELRRQAMIALRHRNIVKKGWTGDVAQEVMLRFRNQLKRQPDLAVDRERVEETFPAWIAARLRFACNDAIDYLYRLHGRDLQWQDERLHADDADGLLRPPAHHSHLADRQRRKSHTVEDVDLTVDLRVAVASLEPQAREAVRLHMAGRTVNQIAEALDLTFWTARTILLKANQRLSRLLRDYAHE